MVTEKQKAAVRSCEEFVATEKFNGDINDIKDVSSYLDRWMWLLHSNNWALTNGYD